MRHQQSRHRLVDVLRATLAGAALLTVLVGFPLVMWRLVGWPLPSSVPDLAELRQIATEQLSGRAIVDVLAVGAWLAWAHFTVCTLVEAAGAVTGRRLRVPFGGMNQELAGRLVASVLLIATVSASSSITLATASAYAADPPAPSRTGSSQSLTGPVTAGGVPSAAVSPAAAVAPPLDENLGAGVQYRLYTVQPTYQGRTDNLWDISERHLGDGTRWREILRLNQGREQAAGGQLSDPDVLRAGWQLRLPADATDLPLETPAAAGQQPAEQHVVQPGETLHEIAHTELGAAADHQELYDSNRGRVQPDGRRLSDPDLIRPGWILDLPGTPPSAVTGAVPPAAPTGVPLPTSSVVPAPQPAPEPPAAAVPVPPAAVEQPAAVLSPAAVEPAPTAAPAEASTAEDSAAEDSAAEDSGDFAWVRTGAGIVALLAASMLVVLARRRDEQRGPRLPGQRVPMPTGSALTTELELRAVEDPIGRDAVDRALRELAVLQDRAGQPLPALRAVRLTAGELELYLAEPQPAPAPAPWTEQNTVLWSLSRRQLQDAIPLEGIEGFPAPYPALVTIGQDDEAGHVLVDLEQLGALAVDGPAETTQAVLTALAVELLSNSWAAGLDVSLVGLCPDLPDAMSGRLGRVRHLADLDQLIEALEERAAEQTRELEAAGFGSPRAARGAADAPEVWAPEIVLLAEPVPPRLRGRLDQVLHRLPEVGIAAVTGAGEPMGEWVLRVQGDGRAVLDPTGLQLTAQQMPAEVYADWLNILQVSNQPPVTGPAWAAQLVADEPDLALLNSVCLVDETLGQVAPVTMLRQDATPHAEEAGSVPPTGFDRTEPAVPAAGPDAPRPALATVSSLTTSRTVVSEDQPSVPVVRVMGELAVLGCRGRPPKYLHDSGLVKANHIAPCTALVAYLALHPGPKRWQVLAEALSPVKRWQADSVGPVVSKARTWLGKDDDGNPFVALFRTHGGHCLEPVVRTDWHLFLDLVGPDAATTSTSQLDSALALVQGPPFSNFDPRFITWTEPVASEIRCGIVDVANEVTRRVLTSHDDLPSSPGERAALARRAIRVGRLIDSSSERILRAALKVEHSAGNTPELRRLGHQLHVQRTDLGELEPETVQLLNELQVSGAR